MSIKQKILSDAHYVNSFSNFILKFECAVAQAKFTGKELVDIYSSYMLKISDHESANRLGKLMIGINYPNRHYYLPSEPHPNVGNKIHPIALMVDGRYTRNKNPYLDLEERFLFLKGTVSDSFVQGFINKPGYKDQWYGAHWSLSSAFYLGRHLLDKHLKITLPYVIPEMLKGIINA